MTDRIDPMHIFVAIFFVAITVLFVLDGSGILPLVDADGPSALETSLSLNR